MDRSTGRTFALGLLALVFTAGLTFASIELPRLLDAHLARGIATPDVATGLSESSDFKTELYIQYYRLRPIGYLCLGIVLLLIVAGFAAEKSGWASAGALLLFLPVFGHFAATMFFLGGLGFLRLLWLPLLDVSFNLFRLADVVDLPYELLASFWSLAGADRWTHPAYVVTGTGLLIFCAGTFAWFSARVDRKAVAHLWVYRFSRHPQYLGWIIWSYGVMYLPGPNIKLCYGLSNSLPWFLSTMIILAVAMTEELKMSRTFGETYDSYRRRAPFLFPVPQFVSKLFAFPWRMMFRKERPERKTEIVAVLGFYTLLVLGASALYGGLAPSPAGSADISPERIARLTQTIRNARSFAERRDAAEILGRMGEPALDSLLALLSDPQPRVRAYAAGALGATQPDRVVGPLAVLLADSDAYVRRMAFGALGRSGSRQAIPVLVAALHDRTRGLAGPAAAALAQIRHPDVVQPLIEALRDTTLRSTAEVVRALGNLGATEAAGPLVRCIEERSDCPFDAVGEALWKLGSDRAVEAWIAGLRRAPWWLPRATCAAALGRHGSDRAVEPLHEALTDTSAEVRRAVVLALMDIGSERSVDALQRAREDADMEVRIYAEEALRRYSPR